MQAFTYYDGVWQAPKDVRIPLSDRAYFFGDAVYEAMIGRSGVIYRERDHLARLFANLRATDMAFYGERHLTDVLHHAARLADGEPFFLYVQVSRDGERRTHAYGDGAGTHLLASVEPYALPDEKKTASLVSVRDRRYGFCHLKTTNLLPNVFAAKEAENCGADEAVFVRGRTVTECSHSNVYIVKDNILYTHPADFQILPGVTRKRVLAIANRLGISTLERSFTLAEMKKSDAVLVSSTTKFLRICDMIDGVRLSVGCAVAELLIAALFRDFEEETGDGKKD